MTYQIVVRPVAVYRPANLTLHVYCSAANLSSLPLDLPPLPKSYVKYKLNFSDNKLLRRLEHRPYFSNTSILDVSNCSLAEINTEVLKDVSRFTLADFRENMLRSFPRLADTVNISARLLVGNNPWRCSCDNSWMIGWLQSLSHRILDPGDVVCRSPSRMYGRSVLKSTEEDFCVDPVKRTLAITLSAVASVAAVILLPVITGVVLYILRKRFYNKSPSCLLGMADRIAHSRRSVQKLWRIHLAMLIYRDSGVKVKIRSNVPVRVNPEQITAR